MQNYLICETFGFKQLVEMVPSMSNVNLQITVKLF